MKLTKIYMVEKGKISKVCGDAEELCKLIKKSNHFSTYLLAQEEQIRQIIQVSKHY